MTLEAIIASACRNAVKQAGGNKTLAAKRLKINRVTLRKYLCKTDTKKLAATAKKSAEARRVANNAWRRPYLRTRRMHDLQHKLSVYLRSRITSAIRKHCKTGSAVRDLGCTIAEFKLYIERQFKQGMNWENWGKWHLDHKKPLSKFDLSIRAQFLKACHYTNMQPLWANENYEKSAR
jgi:hypothetical protein